MDRHRNARTAPCALLAIVASLSACGGPSPDPASTPTTPSPAQPAPNPPIAPAPTDRELAEAVYQDRQRIPPGFYTEPEPPTASGYSTTHLKNTTVTATLPADPSAPSYELCTDDWNQALDWSEDAAHRLPVYSPLTETNANDRYFEFVRARPQPKGWLERQRVFRCTYLDRTATDRTQLAGFGGILHRDTPAATTAPDLKQLAEYLWQFTLFNNYGNAVLASDGRTLSDALEHTLTIVTMTRAASEEACDRFDILRWTHTINLNTGIIDRRLEPVRSFFARESAGTVTECSP